VVKKDEAESYKWRHKAAEQGDVSAQHAVARALLEGHGVKKDGAEAAKWFRKVADQSYYKISKVIAQGELAELYEQGNGVPKDEAEALKWYRRAAESGIDAHAKYKIGFMYLNGQGGLTANTDQASKWFREAAEMGNHNARRAMDIMHPPNNPAPSDLDQSLMLAAQRDDVGDVQKLLAQGAKIGATDVLGRTPLHHAAIFGRAKVVEYLLDKGAKIEARMDDRQSSKQGATPLHCVVDHQMNERDLDTLKVLLSRGAKVDAENSFGETPLHLAAFHAQVEAATLLLDSPDRMADSPDKEYWRVNKKNDYGETPLHEAHNSSDRLEMIRLLCSRGAKLDARDRNSLTPIMRFGLATRFASSGPEDLVKLMLDLGDDVNSDTWEERTFLMLVAEHGDFKLAKLLVERGADIYRVAPSNVTALTLASRRGLVEIVEFLIANVRDGKRKDEIGRAWEAVVDELPGSSQSQLQGLAEIMKLLLKNGANVNARDAFGYTALLRAAGLNYPGIVQVLLENGADVNATPTNSRLFTPLIAALGKTEYTVSTEATVSALLDKGADANKGRDSAGRTARTLALRSGNAALAKLLAKEAPPDATPSGPLAANNGFQIRVREYDNDGTEINTFVLRSKPLVKVVAGEKVLNVDATNDEERSVWKILDANFDFSSVCKYPELRSFSKLHPDLTDWKLNVEFGRHAFLNRIKLNTTETCFAEELEKLCKAHPCVEAFGSMEFFVSKEFRALNEPSQEYYDNKNTDSRRVVGAALGGCPYEDPNLALTACMFKRDDSGVLYLQPWGWADFVCKSVAEFEKPENRKMADETLKKKSQRINK
jgi:ankyrin repeat protein